MMTIDQVLRNLRSLDPTKMSSTTKYRAWSAKRPTTAKQLSKQEIKDYKEAFKMFDKNGDGKISKSDMKEILRSIGIDATDEECRDMISNADVGGKKYLEFEEFLNLMIKKVDGDDNRADELKAAFKVFDRNHDGFISRSELKKALNDMDEHVSDREIDNIIRSADLDKDGRINYHEFVEVLVKDLEAGNFS